MVVGGSATASAAGRHRRVRTLLAVVGAVALGVAVLEFLPRLRHAVGQATRLPAPVWPWIVVAGLAIAASYWFSGLALQVAVGERLPMKHTVLVQLAAAAANRLTPGSVGGAAVNMRFLTNSGYRVGPAGAAVAGVGAAHAVVAVVGLLVFGPATLSRNAGRVVAWLSGAWPQACVAIAVVTAAVAITLRTSAQKRRSAWRRLRAAIGDGLNAAGALAAEPARMVKLIGWVAAVKAANLLAVYATLWAFDGDVAGWRVAVAYLVGVTSVEAIPTPGGLGTVDAALVLGLVGTGSSAGAVLAGVVVYRLLAFWAPIVPGMASSAFLRRHAVL